MSIKFPVSKPVLAGNEAAYVSQAIESTWISSTGRFIDDFERQLSDFIDREGAISVSNGTAGLHLACMAMELKPNADVIVPSLTYVATANAVAYCGANPVFADCDKNTWNLTAKNLEKALTPDTVGVIVVHLYGLPSPMDEIADFCQKHNLWIIEDCAESIGASINGRQTGSFGQAAVFSFYGNKTISTGEGGMVLIPDRKKYDYARLLRGQGMDHQRRYWHTVIGYNYRMTNVAAAIGCAQIEMIDYHLSERRRVAAVYESEFSQLIKNGIVSVQARPHGYLSSNWLSCVVLSCLSSDDMVAREQREKIMQDMQNNHGIETRPFFYCCHSLPMYHNHRLLLPVSEYLSARGINLPSYSGLTDEDIALISKGFIASLKKYNLI